MKWAFKTADPTQIELLAAALRSSSNLGVKPPQLASTLARLLVMRGITDAEAADRFLDPSLSHLHSPYQMTGMKAAVERIDAAIESKEPILIYGDYDVDGTTAIVILKTAIELCGGVGRFPRSASHSRRLRYARKRDRAGRRRGDSSDHQRRHRNPRFRSRRNRSALGRGPDCHRSSFARPERHSAKRWPC